MAGIVLNVEVREKAGTGAARASRRAGNVPGVLYGGPRGPVSIETPRRELDKALRSGNSLMLEAAKELQSSVVHAENAVTAMRRSADAAGRELQTKIDEARAMTAAAQAASQYLREEPQRDAVRPVDFSLRRRSVL